MPLRSFARRRFLWEGEKFLRREGSALFAEKYYPPLNGLDSQSV
jgi:hypothetical protein